MSILPTYGCDTLAARPDSAMPEDDPLRERVHETGADLTSAPTQATGDELFGAGMIGPYRLLQRIAEGGMGEIWLAEQKQPVRRRVALKLIKTGLDSREIVRRFESERQALAMMDHPAIATVFDAGSTAQGTSPRLRKSGGIPLRSCRPLRQAAMRSR